MSTLFGLLDLGAGALHTQNAGIAVSSNNTSNVNTDGYSRQRVDFRAQLASPLVGGVTFGDPVRISDELLVAREREGSSALGFSNAYADAMRSLESSLSGPGTDLTSAVADLFARFNDLASTPLDGLSRDAVRDSARTVAVTINRQAATLVAAQDDSDGRVGLHAREASALAQKIAEANRVAYASQDPAMLDQRDLAARQLSALVGGRARVDPDGHMRFVLDDGTVVVDGNRAASFETSPDASRGNYLKIEVVDGVHRRDVTTSLSAGMLGGELNFRDVTSANLVTDLDQYAFDLATQINTVHQANAGLDGVAGRDFFGAPAVAVGAAVTFALDAGVDGDSSLIAGAAAGSAGGDNQGALALVALRDQNLAGGNSRTLIDETIRVLADLGRDTATAQVDREFRELHQEGLSDLRDSVAGVSIQDELTRLSQFQHAADASARFLGTIDELLGRIIQSI